MTKEVMKEIADLYHELSEIFDEMAGTDDEEVIEHLKEKAVALSYSVKDKEAEFCL